MEPAKIDWKRIESRFVEDHVYERINAPKWVNFLDPEDDSPDDVAWFCRPDCNHPQSVEDFLKTTPTSKVRSSAGGNQTPSHGDLAHRAPSLKRRGQGQLKEDVENLNPNMSTPPCRQAKATKAAFKCSSEKKQPSRDDNDMAPKEDVPRLRSTLSARNLFAGRDILNHITEFCNELKKLTTRAKQRENNEEKTNEKRKNNQETAPLKQVSGSVLRDLNDKQRKSRIEAGKENSQNIELGKDGGNRSQKLADEAENIPLSLNLENIKHKGGEQLLQIRTMPPSPQCFSDTHASIKTTPPKASRSRLAERGVLQELKPTQEVKKDDPACGAGKAANGGVSVAAGREAGALDMFWFLKPCTVSD